MPFKRDGSQPFRGDPRSSNRTYVPAVWDEPGQGTGHPKLSGGYEVNGAGLPIPTRGFNRADQRYQGDPAVLTSRRAIRAANELSATALVRGSNSWVDCRTETGNVYHLTDDGSTCDCPDQWRLDESFPNDDVPCKHRQMLLILLGQEGLDGIPWGVRKLAEEAGCRPRTMDGLLRAGQCPATKKNGVWVVDPIDAAAFAEEYKARVVTFPNEVNP